MNNIELYQSQAMKRLTPLNVKRLKKRKRVVLLFVSLPLLVCWRGLQSH